MCHITKTNSRLRASERPFLSFCKYVQHSRSRKTEGRRKPSVSLNSGFKEQSFTLLLWYYVLFMHTLCCLSLPCLGCTLSRSKPGMHGEPRFLSVPHYHIVIMLMFGLSSHISSLFFLLVPTNICFGGVFHCIVTEKLYLRKGTLEVISSRLPHWKGTLEVFLSCFIYHRGIQEGTFAIFFEHGGIGWGNCLTSVHQCNQWLTSWGCSLSAGPKVTADGHQSN